MIYTGAVLRMKFGLVLWSVCILWCYLCLVWVAGTVWGNNVRSLETTAAYVVPPDIQSLSSKRRIGAEDERHVLSDL